VAKKTLIYSLSYSIYGVCGEGLVENVIWGRGERGGWLKTSEYRHIWVRESKIAQKTVIRYLNVP